MTGHKPVLVFGSDTNAFLATVRSLGRAGIAVHAAGCDAERPAGRSRYITAHHDIPHYTDDGGAWVARIRDLAARHDYALLIPTSDSSLAQLDAHRADLEEARLAIASHQAIATFVDKGATRALAQRLGIPVAPGRAVTAEDSADALLGEFGSPLIVKTARSYTPGDAAQKAPVGLFSDPAELATRLWVGDDLLVERFVPGFCRGVSVLCHEGRVLQAFQHRRLRQEHRTGPSSWRVSEALDPRLGEAVSALMAATRYTGVAMAEFRFRESEDAFCLLEVNPRFWGSLHLALAAGADYPALLHAMLIEGRLPPERHDFGAGIEKFSLWGEFDSLAGRIEQARPLAALPGALLQTAGYLGRLAADRRFDSFAPDDPAPFYAERRQVLRRFRRRLLGKSLGGRTGPRG